MPDIITQDAFSPARRNAVLVVALSALVSIIACSGLFIYVLAKAFLGWRVQYNSHGSVRTELKFYRTQFGVLFLSLVLSDLIQAIGFVMGLDWVGKGGLPKSGEITSTCTAQALMIQWGDVASALLAVFIAIHTGLILVLKFRPPNASIAACLALMWIFDIGLGIYGPVLVQEEAKGPFYGVAGNWCWISKKYDMFRIYVHYDILFAAAGINLLIYLCIYAALKARKHHNPDRINPSRLSRFSSKLVGRPIETEASFESQSTDEVAKRMLVYPIAYILVILPLSTYRTAGAAGHDWGLTANAICGAIFVSSGWVNVLMFVWTRRLVVWPGKHRTAKVPVSHVQPYVDESAHLRRFTLLSTYSGPATKQISSPTLIHQSSFCDLDNDSQSQIISFAEEDAPLPYDLRANALTYQDYHGGYVGQESYTSDKAEEAGHAGAERDRSRTSVASSRRNVGSGRRRTSARSLSLSQMSIAGVGTAQ